VSLNDGATAACDPIAAIARSVTRTRKRPFCVIWCRRLYASIALVPACVSVTGTETFGPAAVAAHMSVAAWPAVLGRYGKSKALRTRTTRSACRYTNSEAKYGYPMRHMDILAT
jgi:hypothetical protein